MAFKVILLTDRRLVALDELPARIGAILAAAPRGAVAIQIREKDLDGGPLLALTRAALAVARPAGAEVWVNDRLDVALAAGADGVHLPEHGLALAAARSTVSSLGRSLQIGCSRHTAADARAAADAGADLVQLGPIWSVPNKGEPLGAAALTQARAAKARLVAVGGIDSPARATEAARSGADAVAIIRAAWQSTNAPAAIAEIVQALE